MTAGAGIVGIGLNCPLGQGLEAAGRSYHARQRNFLKSPKGPVGPDGNPIILSCVMPFDKIRNYELRLQRLFAGAVEDFVSHSPIAGPMALRLVLPAWLVSHKLSSQLRNWIRESYSSLFQDIEFLADGNTIALYEVAKAWQQVGAGEVASLVVGALDSHMDAELLDLLIIDGRLHHRENPHGLIPGEAAVLFMLGAPEPEEPGCALGAIKAVFTGYERESLSSPQGVIGRGMAKPLRQAFETYIPDRFLADLNGERWRSEDIGFALSGARVPDALLADIETPIGQTGDCGAANSLIMAAIALAPAHEKSQSDDALNAAVGTISIVSTALRQGPRLVAVMEAFNGQGEAA
ncbi:hypothetical protein [Rhizobium leguminosarum]|uniref:hypothetical protein n=1 Tax=Rhizobium leguminosarum TaxID=384 RepID=UPI003F99733A